MWHTRCSFSERKHVFRKRLKLRLDPLHMMNLSEEAYWVSPINKHYSLLYVAVPWIKNAHTYGGSTISIQKMSMQLLSLRKRRSSQRLKPLYVWQFYSLLPNYLLHSVIAQALPATSTLPASSRHCPPSSHSHSRKQRQPRSRLKRNELTSLFEFSEISICSTDIFTWNIASEIYDKQTNSKERHIQSFINVQRV